MSIDTRSGSSSWNCCEIEETCLWHEWCPSTLVERFGQSSLQLWYDSHASLPGTSSDSETTVPVLLLQQGRAASSQGPAASANSGDEDSEYSAQSHDSGRTVPKPSLCFETMMNVEQWRLRHTSMPQQLDPFVLLQKKMEISRTNAIWLPCCLYNDHCNSMKWPITSVTYSWSSNRSWQSTSRYVGRMYDDLRKGCRNQSK